MWLMGLFAVSVGLPFFALSANGPLLQAWFARTGHRAAADPYFLYGASNFGSFLALIAYPFLIEPLLPLNQQSSLWTLGFAVLGGVIGLCGGLLLATPGAPIARVPAATVPVTWAERLTWIGLSAVPSGLLVAVTAHVTTDVAAVPLLWVVPLALFLLTFVLAFREGAGGLNRAMLAVQPACWRCCWPRNSSGPRSRGSPSPPSISAISSSPPWSATANSIAAAPASRG